MTIKTTDGRVISIAAFARQPFPLTADPRLVRPPIAGHFNVRGLQPMQQTYIGPGQLSMPITIMTKDSSGNDKPIKIFSAPPGMQMPDVNGQPPALTGNADLTANKASVSVFTGLLNCII